MIHFLNDVCTILKPNLDDEGKLILEDFGDYFCKIEPGVIERYLPKYITHKAKMNVNGARAGWILITAQHNFVIVSVDKKTNTLGLVIQK